MSARRRVACTKTWLVRATCMDHSRTPASPVASVHRRAALSHKATDPESVCTNDPAKTVGLDLPRWESFAPPSTFSCTLYPAPRTCVLYSTCPSAIPHVTSLTQHLQSFFFFVLTQVGWTASVSATVYEGHRCVQRHKGTKAAKAGGVLAVYLMVHGMPEVLVEGWDASFHCQTSDRWCRTACECMVHVHYNGAWSGFRRSSILQRRILRVLEHC
jgi:hypothetical protein